MADTDYYWLGTTSADPTNVANWQNPANTVGGVLNPDATGVYVQSGTHNSQKAYTTAGYWLWFDYTNNVWIISTAKGDYTPNWRSQTAGVGGLVDTYDPLNGATGDATVADSPVSPTATIPTSSDHVICNGDGDNALTLSADFPIGSLTTVVGYNSKLDMVTFDLTIAGDVALAQADEFDCGTGTLSIGGDFDCADIGTFTKGSSTLIANGTGTQAWDLGAEAVGAIEVTKTGLLRFDGGWTADSFSHAAGGTVDFNEQTIETVGDFVIAAGAWILAGADAMNGVALTVGGDFLVAGTSGIPLNLRAEVGDPWALALTGTGTASHVNVAYGPSNSLVTASHSTGTGTTTNWTFATPKPGLLPVLASFHGQDS
jgi:hypothetical protein